MRRVVQTLAVVLAALMAFASCASQTVMEQRAVPAEQPTPTPPRPTPTAVPRVVTEAIEVEAAPVEPAQPRREAVPQPTPTPTPTSTPSPTPTSTPTPTPDPVLSQLIEDTDAALAESDRVIWCVGGSAENVFNALQDLTYVMADDPNALEFVFTNLWLVLLNEEVQAPAELALTMASAVETTDELRGFLADADWDFQSADQDQFIRLDARFEQAIVTLDRFNVDQCNFPSALVISADGEPTDIESEPAVLPVATDRDSQIATWAELTSSPELGIGSRLGPLIPFPTSHLIPATSIDSLNVLFVEFALENSVQVDLRYRTALSVEEASDALRAPLEANGTLDEFSTNPAGDVTIGSYEDAYGGDGWQRITVRQDGDGSTIDVSFNVDDLAPETGERILAASRSWFQDDWPTSGVLPDDELIVSMDYTWSPPQGATITIYFDQIVGNGLQPDEIRDQFLIELESFDTSWTLDDVQGEFQVYKTLDGSSCALLFDTAISFTGIYQELGPADCWS